MASRKAILPLMFGCVPVTPPGMSGPPLSLDAGNRPNYERDELGGITTRAPVGPDPAQGSAPGVDQGLSFRRPFRYQG